MELSVAVLAAVLEAVRMQQVEPRAMGGDPNGWHRVTRPQRHVLPVPCSSWFVTRCQGEAAEPPPVARMRSPVNPAKHRTQKLNH